MPIKPTMPMKMPKGGKAPKLMDVQDTKHKGDSLDGGKVMMSFMIPIDLKTELKERAGRLGTSSTRLIVDGIRLRLKQQD